MSDCTVKGCPDPRNETDFHTPWCKGVHECFGEATHQHWPKIGMGGNNPKSKIVACLCAGMHDAVDNSPKYGNAVMEINGQRVYRIWDQHNATILERVIGEADGQVDTQISATIQEARPTVPKESTLPSVRPPIEPSHPSIQFTPTGLKVTGRLTFEDWQQVGVTIRAMKIAIR